MRLIRFPRGRAALASLLLAAPLLLTGCAGPYQLPAGVPTAEVKVVSMLVTTTLLGVQDVADCPSPTYSRLATFESVEGRQMLAFVKGEPFDPVRTQTTHIAARGWMALDATVPGPSCSVRVMFLPEAGGRYEATIDGRFNQCSLKLLKLETGPDGATRREVDRTAFQVRGSGGGAICSR